MKRKVGISTFGLQSRYGDAEAIRIAKRIGADAIDFSLGRYESNSPDSIYSKSREEIEKYFSELKSLADQLGIEICQTHGRGPGFKNKKEEDEALLHDAELDCLATSLLGAPVCVIHAVTTIFMGPDAPRELMHSLNFDMFDKMLVFAREYNIKIATETFGDAMIYDCCDFFGKIDEFTESYGRVCAKGNNAENFCICVDTGHSNKAMRFGNPTPADVIRRLGKDIQVLHLHDNDTLTDQHKIPKTGCIDWNDVMNALDEIGYSGVYNIEIELNHFGENMMIDEAEFGIKVMKNILHEHYGDGI